MADMLVDPFNAQQQVPVEDPNAGVSQFGMLKAQWDNFLADPRGRAALLSTGLALMQPPSWGDTGASQIARAIGAGGESVRGTEELDRKQLETESKADLRSAQAVRAEAGATAAGARANSAADRLAYQNADLERKRQADLERQKLQTLGRFIQAQGVTRRAYDNHVKNYNAVNDPLRLGSRYVPPPDYQTWLSQNPQYQAMIDAARPGGPTAGDFGESESMAPTDSFADRFSASGAAAGGPNPNAVGRTIEVAPANPTERRVGERYRSPTTGQWGTWTGSGWTDVRATR